MLKSYYDILNVESTASKKEIKNRFKTLVKMYHPDVNSSQEAEEIFKEINKAAEILLDDTKRKNYDLLRKANNNIYKKTASPYTFNDIFQKKEKPKKENKTLPPKKGDDITVNVSIDYTEAILGTNRVVNISRSTVCPVCLGHKFANGQKCHYCDGLGEKTFNKKITVKIPAGLNDKTKLRLKGEGQTGINGGENGHLYVIVNIEKNDELKIKDGIVYSEAQISPYMAILGGNIQVATLWGEATIKIPPLTKSNQSFKLIDVGVLNEKTNKKGEQIVKIIIQIPSKITDEEFQLYEKLREINSKKKNAKSI